MYTCQKLSLSPLILCSRHSLWGLLSGIRDYWKEQKLKVFHDRNKCLELSNLVSGALFGRLVLGNSRLSPQPSTRPEHFCVPSSAPLLKCEWLRSFHLLPQVQLTPDMTVWYFTWVVSSMANSTGRGWVGLSRSWPHVLSRTHFSCSYSQRHHEPSHQVSVILLMLIPSQFPSAVKSSLKSCCSSFSLSFLLLISLELGYTLAS